MQQLTNVRSRVSEFELVIEHLLILVINNVFSLIKGKG